MEYLICTVIGYLLGCLSPSYFISKAKGFDIRDKGTGNAGASNVTVTLGWVYGVITAVCDVLKGSLSVIICQKLFPGIEIAGVVGGTACILGHIFPFYMNFKGGKGYASYTGVMLVLNWKLALMLILAGVVITVVTNFIALATIFTVIFYPIYYYFHLPLAGWLCILIASLVMIYKHRINIQRIINKEEIGLRKAKKII